MQMIASESMLILWRSILGWSTKVPTNVQGEPGFSYKVAGWNLEIAGWNEELQADIQPIFYKIFYFK
jgi:hypothetical protein